MILNYEILLCVLILIHICIIIFIGLHKLYISYGLNIISKLFSQKIAEKYENFKKKIENIGTMYLIILIIITILSDRYHYYYYHYYFWLWSTLWVSKMLKHTLYSTARSFAPLVLIFSSISLQSLGVGQWEARYSQRPELLKQHK